MLQAQQRLDLRFSEDIYLEGRSWRESPRYYRGDLNGNHLSMIGPKKINSDSFWFRAQGELTSHSNQTILHFKIQLNHPYLYILIWVSMIASLIAFLVPKFGLVGYNLTLFCVGFFYVMVQWYLQYYSNEICQLIKNVITDSPINSSLDQLQKSSLNPYLARQHKIPNYLPQAILVTIFCCAPLGSIAITYAARAISKYRTGDYRGAMKASIVSRNWCWAAFLFGILAYVLITLLVTNSF
ncbi:hypothetical protein AM1_G0034 (plasmid) [Acaryochloris marina MBIC11017]|uniref:Uncharacterized protein n=2 Tax=Acaryochloris marina TaxID=155978 RepID=A8ZQC8_ACAM1|nr:hypothetical protein AM1_G0034 [Acaryochloris marina MBIC11017]